MPELAVFKSDVISFAGNQSFINVQEYLHREGYGTLFSGIKKLVAGLSILLLL
jgi:hypothetical protein